MNSERDKQAENIVLHPEIAKVAEEMRAVAHPEYIRDSSVCDAINDWATRLESAKGEVQGVGLSEGECAFCGEPVNSLAGNPSRWPLTFSHPDGTGKVKHHHVGCVVTRLFSTPPESGAVAWQYRVLRGDKCWMQWTDWPHDERPAKIGRWDAEYRPLYAHPSPGVAGVSEAPTGDSADISPARDSAKLLLALDLLKEVRTGHRTADSVNFNNCEHEQCAWCDDADIAIAALTAALSAKESKP
jgi:hypothetical protein